MKNKAIKGIIAVVMAVAAVMSLNILPAQAATLKTKTSGIKAPTTLTYRSSYSLRGTVSASRKITKVQVRIEDNATAKTEAVASVKTRSKKVTLTPLSRKLKFGKLTLGEKTLSVKIWCGKTSKIVYQKVFTVKKPPRLTAKVSGMKTPTTLIYKKSYSLRGTIKASKTITKVQVRIKDSKSKKTEASASVRTNSKKVTLTALSKKIAFGKLKLGDKMLTVKIWSGKESKTVYQKEFTVERQKAARPKSSVSSGTYTEDKTVKLTTSTSNGTIYYTLDGSVPSTKSKKYTKPVKISADTPGTTVLKAVTYKKGMALSSVRTVSITMAEVLPETVTLSSDSYHMFIGDTRMLTPVFTPGNVNVKDVAWTSGAPAVATVDENGKVTALSAGTATITCRSVNGLEFAAVLTVLERTHVHMKQEPGKCTTACYAMMLTNMGIEGVTPAGLSAACGGSVTDAKLRSLYGVKMVCALDGSSPYLSSYKSGMTYVKSGAENVEAAIKEALVRHPEGVMVYGTGGGRHGVVAATVDGAGNILYDDPGRDYSKGYHVTWKGTWNAVGYGQTLANVEYIAALDFVE